MEECTDAVGGWHNLKPDGAAEIGPMGTTYWLAVAMTTVMQKIALATNRRRRRPPKQTNTILINKIINVQRSIF